MRRRGWTFRHGVVGVILTLMLGLLLLLAIGWITTATWVDPTVMVVSFLLVIYALIWNRMNQAARKRR